MSRSASKSLARIREQSARIRAILGTRELTAPVTQSAWCVAEHLDHTLKVTTSTLQVLLKSELPPLPKGINLVGRMVLLFGWIPRGRGKAPEKLVGTTATSDELKTRLSELDDVIARVGAEPPRDATPVLRHPMFGGLTFAQSLRFVAIHTAHHLKIIGAK